jgi:hypothetical protein
MASMETSGEGETPKTILRIKRRIDQNPLVTLDLGACGPRNAHSVRDAL